MSLNIPEAVISRQSLGSGDHSGIDGSGGGTQVAGDRTEGRGRGSDAGTGKANQDTAELLAAAQHSASARSAIVESRKIEEKTRWTAWTSQT